MAVKIPQSANAFERRVLRETCGKYRAKPDPIGWRQAADIYEEHGDPDTAQLWRRRAEWYEVFKKQYDLFLSTVRDVSFRRTMKRVWKRHICGYEIRFESTRARKTVWVDVTGAGGWMWMKHSKNPQYITNQILWLLDALTGYDLIEKVRKAVQ